jgi:hypothetical protein
MNLVLESLYMQKPCKKLIGRKMLRNQLVSLNAGIKDHKNLTIFVKYYAKL